MKLFYVNIDNMNGDSLSQCVQARSPQEAVQVLAAHYDGEHDLEEFCNVEEIPLPFGMIGEPKVIFMTGYVHLDTEEALAYSPPEPVKSGALEIYTDGACAGNPGPAGSAMYIPAIDWKAIQSDPQGTNNTAELGGIILALDYLIQRRTPEAVVYSDSQYCVRGINEWMHNWALNGWTTSAGKPVANKELWLRINNQLYNLNGYGQKVTFVWVKGHYDNAGNIMADRLACIARDQAAGKHTA